jgi:ABC-type uncharacterized transport system permease subunit
MLTMSKHRHAQRKPSSSQAAMQFGISVPNALLIMLPYLLALLAAGGLVGRQMAPATLGEPYRR